MSEPRGAKCQFTHRAVAVPSLQRGESRYEVKPSGARQFKFLRCRQHAAKLAEGKRYLPQTNHFYWTTSKEVKFACSSDRGFESITRHTQQLIAAL